MIPCLVLGNWKMNTGLREATLLAESLAAEALPDGVIVGVAPPFPWLTSIATILGASAIRLGAQTSAREENGAFTGEVSAAMLAELCDFVLVGHSERRTLFGETDPVVADKLTRIIDVGLQPVLCVGETAEQRNAGAAESVVRSQLNAALSGRSPSDLDALVVAYEPVWAIGTGNTATPDDAAEMCELIRGWLSSSAGVSSSVLYGGSVNAANAAVLIGTNKIDGFLVGGASLKVGDFMTIIRACAD
jgi:triosephosphate isomerase